mmetsp:Transcript_6520/g.17074  ORF Transcript_6520/g.17074 Transcript_6520/m.17074 type:complete len:224 (+) Transcript_6520:410-1081(+)
MVSACTTKLDDADRCGSIGAGSGGTTRGAGSSRPVNCSSPRIVCSSAVWTRADEWTRWTRSSTPCADRSVLLSSEPNRRSRDAIVALPFATSSRSDATPASTRSSRTTLCRIASSTCVKRCITSSRSAAIFSPRACFTASSDSCSCSRETHPKPSQPHLYHADAIATASPAGSSQPSAARVLERFCDRARCSIVRLSAWDCERTSAESSALGAAADGAAEGGS